MKIFFRKIHLYLALACGIIIAITCLTGAILVFEKDLQQTFYSQRYFVNPVEKTVATDLLIENALDEVPGSTLRGIKIYNDPARSAEINISQKSGDEETRLTVFMNPYNGQVLETYNHRESFFYFVMDVHRWMLGGATGKLIVGISTLVFLFILITGMVLWWPRNKTILLQRLKIKTDASFKRLNHDFHIALGFYSAIFLFVFAFTGLAWSFEWFNDAIYKVTGTKNEKPPKLANLSDSTMANAPFETYLFNLQTQAPKAVYYAINAPSGNEPVSASFLPHNALHETATTQVNMDSKTGEVLNVRSFQDRNLGQQVRATFKPVHIASIWGPWSKWIGFITCLLGFLFPVSGYIMWYHRAFKKKKKTLKKGLSGMPVMAPVAVPQMQNEKAS